MTTHTNTDKVFVVMIKDQQWLTCDSGCRTCYIYWALPCEHIPKFKDLCPRALCCTGIDSAALAVALRIPLVVAECMKCGNWMEVCQVEESNTMLCRLECCGLILTFYPYILE